MEQSTDCKFRVTKSMGIISSIAKTLRILKPGNRSLLAVCSPVFASVPMCHALQSDYEPSLMNGHSIQRSYALSVPGKLSGTRNFPFNAVRVAAACWNAMLRCAWTIFPLWHCSAHARRPSINIISASAAASSPSVHSSGPFDEMCVSVVTQNAHLNVILQVTSGASGSPATRQESRLLSARDPAKSLLLSTYSSVRWRWTWGADGDGFDYSKEYSFVCYWIRHGS